MESSPTNKVMTQYQKMPLFLVAWMDSLKRLEKLSKRHAPVVDVSREIFNKLPNSISWNVNLLSTF